MFLAGGGQRGRRFQILTDGTYFINRGCATVQLLKKTVVPIGYVGVVISYYGKKGTDLSGTAFRHGERVANGEYKIMRSNVLGDLVSLLLAQNTACAGTKPEENTARKQLADRMVGDAISILGQSAPSPPPH